MSEAYRPSYHFTPPVMWMNDPNGLVYYKGEYHLFYQHHPESNLWGPMHWGHAVSHDLINWKHLPIALHPDDNGMIFSGSAVVDWENTAGFGREALVAIFTYNKNYKETQNLAYSTDAGRTWKKYEGNPVIPAPEPLSDFRDPKVFRHQGQWILLLAAKDRILFFASSDLKHWEPTGSFGPGFGSTDGVWETPDLFCLPVNGDASDSRWVLTVGVGNGHPAGGSGTQYFIGNFDGKTFISEAPKETVLWADWGGDYYAPQSWHDEPNGRRLMIGWMSNWQYAALLPTDGWRSAMSLIREISLAKTDEGICIVHQPIHELQTLRTTHHRFAEILLRPGENPLGNISGNSMEINAEFEITDGAEIFGIFVHAGENERTVIQYNAQTNQLTLDRSRSGITDFKDGFTKVHSAYVQPQDARIRMHIFIDACSVEVFANNGLAVITDCVFPTETTQSVEVFTEGSSVTLHTFEVFHLKPAKFQR